MSRFNQKNREQARTDSRRFAKGTVCRIIQGQGIVGSNILKILSTNKLVPDFVKFNMNAESPAAIDIKSGRMFVIPTTEHSEYERLLAQLGNDNLQFVLAADSKPTTGPLENKPRQEANALLRTQDIYQAVTKFLKQNIIMVRVPKIRVSTGNFKAEDFDVIIETVDLSQTIDGSLVDRYKPDSISNNKKL